MLKRKFYFWIFVDSMLRAWQSQFSLFDIFSAVYIQKIWIWLRLTMDSSGFLGAVMDKKRKYGTSYPFVKSVLGTKIRKLSVWASVFAVHSKSRENNGQAFSGQIAPKLHNNTKFNALCQQTKPAHVAESLATGKTQPHMLVWILAPSPFPGAPTQWKHWKVMFRV